jgi:outer membrane protein assembly factor BamA
MTTGALPIMKVGLRLAFDEQGLQIERGEVTEEGTAIVSFVGEVPWRLSTETGGEWLYSAGLGVRYQTLIGPVRLEYGHNLNPRPLDPRGTLHLSVGFPF